MIPRRGLMLVLLPAALAACRDAAIRPAAPVVTLPVPSTTATADAAASLMEPPDGPIPPLRTGAIAPIEHPEIIEAKLIARHTGPALETLAVALAIPEDVNNELEDTPLATVT